MHIERLGIPGVAVITPQKHGDKRGFFSEIYNKKRLAEHQIDSDFVQDNHSQSAETGTIRGLHFQAPPHAQGKLVRVSRGAVLDVAVDIRRGSPTYGQHVALTLSADNWRQLWVPKGLAHGFCTLEPNTEVLYKVTDYYDPVSDFGLAWDDAALGIDWPVTGASAIVSDKDQQHPTLADLPHYFDFAKHPD